MKLPIVELDLDTQLAEFDVWITPSLGEIRDTDRFALEMDRVTTVFDMLSVATQQFKRVTDCNPLAIADTFLQSCENANAETEKETLQSLASVLFLVTGKSDNNGKCQLPIHLRDVARWQEFPAVRKRKGKAILHPKPIPRELKAEKVVKSLMDLRAFPGEKRRLLIEFIGFVLSDDCYIAQLWSVGKSYCALKTIEKHRHLLTPLVVFQVRGSVSASGGHDPEEMLRQRMMEWGMHRECEFNIADVVVAEEGTGKRKKTRAYDFVLPFDVAGWPHHIYVQCQFYAGDSGSVSHKNVDQTSTSRLKVCEHNEMPVFIEYVDGAGYFSSLNGDLKNLLSMDDTKSFIQIRSAPIRLRRELQAIGFLTPLEIEHAIAFGKSSVADVEKTLKADGYAISEVRRAISRSLETKVVKRKNDILSIAPKRRELVRRYLLLDVVANFGSVPESQDAMKGAMLIPGYGPFFGMKLDELAKKATEVAPGLKRGWTAAKMLSDIRWLCEQGMAISH